VRWDSDARKAAYEMELRQEESELLAKLVGMLLMDEVAAAETELSNATDEFDPAIDVVCRILAGEGEISSNFETNLCKCKGNLPKDGNTELNAHD